VKTARRANGTITRVARERLGYDALRPGQRDAIQAALAGRDVLAVMPTGAGKSAIYQIAAHLLPGPAIVVSPLIALQHDQVAALESGPLGDAVAVNSTSSPSRRRNALEDVERGDVDFVFLAPEQLANRETLAQLRATRPALFVVDEAHCISHWGPDFRPWYLQLGIAADALGRPPILALTATASPRVRADIVDRLGMRRPLVIVHAFDRPNIRLEVVHATDAIAKKNALVERVRLADTPGIVYAATRATVLELTAALAARGVSAVAYHGGLTAKTREAAQRDFMEGRIPVIVATNAFGLGIDKPDVRFVFHHNAPESLDAYYQEIGRAGRDGEPASAVLFFAPDDLRLQRFFATGGRLRPRDVVHVASAVHEARGEVAFDDLQQRLDVSKPKLTRILVELDRLGIVSLVAGGRVRRGTPPPDIAEVAERIAALDDARRDAGVLQVELMRAYAEMDGCRRGFLLEHFGEPVEAVCGRCDGCDARPTDAPPPRPRVVHDELGPGLVLNPVGGANDAVLVLFHSVGQRAVPLGELAVAGERPRSRPTRRRAVRPGRDSTRPVVSATHGLP
jgi:ATP-dependent DNA helicase RecQ